jgi:hypothetical protein
LLPAGTYLLRSLKKSIRETSYGSCVGCGYAWPELNETTNLVGSARAAFDRIRYGPGGGALRSMRAPACRYAAL